MGWFEASVKRLFSLIFQLQNFISHKFVMSLNNNGSGKTGKFLIDLEDDDDDFDFPSDDEIEISDDQRIMEEIVQRDRERETRVAEKLIRSQTQENTLINSGEKKAKSRVTDHTDVCLLSAGGVIDENTIFVPKSWPTLLQIANLQKVLPE